MSKKTVYFNSKAIGEIEDSGNPSLDAWAAAELLRAHGIDMERIPAREAYMHARSFGETSFHLYKSGLRNFPRESRFIAPYVVNSAFAIELFLKALGLKHGHSMSGHSLLKLFKQLPAAALADVTAVFPRFSKENEELTTEVFSAHLSHLNSAFVDWRYLFEKDEPIYIEIEPIRVSLYVLDAAYNYPSSAR